jgi:hypothetical protein
MRCFCSSVSAAAGLFGCPNEKRNVTTRTWRLIGSCHFNCGGDRLILEREKLKEPVGREFSRGSKEVSWFGEYEGECTEERPLLLELELFSHPKRLHASRQNQKVLISWAWAIAGLEKITRLEHRQCKYGTFPQN